MRSVVIIYVKSSQSAMKNWRNSSIPETKSLRKEVLEATFRREILIDGLQYERKNKVGRRHYISHANF
ncbi:hypothetical protein QQG55_41205 [Brugia pahangi]